MEESSTKKASFFQKINKKYRLVLLSEFTFEECISFKISPLRIILLFLFYLLLFIAAGLVIADMVKDYVSKHTAIELRNEIRTLNTVVDSLETSLNNYQYKSQAVYNVLKENHEYDKINIDSILKLHKNSVSLKALVASEKDEELRKEVAQKEQFSIISSTEKQEVIAKSISSLIAPIKGKVIHDFKPKDFIYGTDLQTKEDDEILAIANGVVLYTAWTIDKGTIIVIRHDQGLISFNEGIKKQIVKKGQRIKQGEVIGSSTTLYGCKLWLENRFIDPNLYLNFIKLSEE